MGSRKKQSLRGPVPINLKLWVMRDIVGRSAHAYMKPQRLKKMLVTPIFPHTVPRIAVFIVVVAVDQALIVLVLVLVVLGHSIYQQCLLPWNLGCPGAKCSPERNNIE